MHFVRERKKVLHAHGKDHHRMFVLWTENDNHLLLMFPLANPYFIPISEVMYIDFMDMQCLRNIPICAHFLNYIVCVCFPFFSIQLLIFIPLTHNEFWILLRFIVSYRIVSYAFIFIIYILVVVVDCSIHSTQYIVPFLFHFTDICDWCLQTNADI